MENIKNNCKLCGNAINGKNFKLIDEVIKDILGTLLLNLTFNDAIFDFMCSSCSQKLFAALNFKWMCLGNGTNVPYSEKSPAVDLKQNYVKEESNNGLDKQICHLCKIILNNEYVSVRNIQADIIQIYIPEINNRKLVESFICKKCYDSLSAHSSFIKNCLEVEKMRCNDVMGTLYNDSYIKTEEIEFKYENETEEMCRETQFTLKFEDLKQESNADTNISDHCISQLTEKPKSSSGMYECSHCEFESKNKFHLTQHVLTHKEPSEVQTYRCSECEYVSRFKGNLSRHVLTHKDPSEYKCTECNFQTMHKRGFKIHQLKHKDPSELQTYKCTECKYVTRVKGNLPRHLLTHKDPNEYKCTECKFQTMHKRGFKTHQLRHKDPSEVQMYKCSECQLETKYKQNLEIHQLVHKDPSEAQMYKCSECQYETIYKKYFRRHQLIHKDPLEVQIYKCTKCKFETRYKRSFDLHELGHKDPSEVQIYNCDECKYETRFIKNFKYHQLKHKDPPNAPVYNYSEWRYECKIKE